MTRGPRFFPVSRFSAHKREEEATYSLLPFFRPPTALWLHTRLLRQSSRELPKNGERKKSERPSRIRKRQEHSLARSRLAAASLLKENCPLLGEHERTLHTPKENAKQLKCRRRQLFAPLLLSTSISGSLSLSRMCVYWNRATNAAGRPFGRFGRARVAKQEGEEEEEIVARVMKKVRADGIFRKGQLRCLDHRRVVAREWRRSLPAGSSVKKSVTL